MSVLEEGSPRKKTKSVYISTVISIALVLLMIGLLGLILVNAKNLSKYVKENIVLNIIVNDNVSEGDVLNLQKDIEKDEYILRTEYVSKDQAAKNLKEDLGEDFVEYLGKNPLLPSIDIYLKEQYANSDSIQTFIQSISKNNKVKEVIYQESLIDMVNQNIRTISMVVLAFAIILLVISIALINNTIRLSIYSQRFLIKSMQLIGATKNFIRKPYILYGILHGIIGSLIAILLLIFTLQFAQKQIPEIIILGNWTEFSFIFLTIIVLGVLISGLSTYFAVTKYLKAKSSTLYR